MTNQLVITIFCMDAVEAKVLASFKPAYLPGSGGSTLRARSSALWHRGSCILRRPPGGCRACSRSAGPTSRPCSYATTDADPSGRG